jgi:hypothetical protein
VPTDPDRTHKRTGKARRLQISPRHHGQSAIDGRRYVNAGETVGEYGAEWSLARDVRYLLATFLGTGRGDAAKRNGSA